MQKFLKKIRRSIKKNLNTFNKNWIKRKKSFKRSILMCRDNQASYLSSFSVVKENVCFQGCSEHKPDAVVH